MLKNWIKKAIKKPGSFTSYCKSKGYEGVTESCISEGKDSKDATTRKRATLAKTLRGMKSGGSFEDNLANLPMLFIPEKNMGTDHTLDGYRKAGSLLIDDKESSVKGSVVPINTKTKKRYAVKNVKQVGQNLFVKTMAKGGKAYIPHGKMHRYEHGIDEKKVGTPLTKHGIPVVAELCDNEGCRISQVAEIEAAEIIFTKSQTDALEKLIKQYNSSKDPRVLEKIGIFARNILKNAEDETGKFQKQIDKLKNASKGK